MSDKTRSSFFSGLNKKYSNSYIVQPKQMIKSVAKASKTYELGKIFVAELIGTGFLMYFGCMSTLPNPGTSESPAPMKSGLVFGFVVCSIIVAIGHISKAHLNPAVTLCSYLLGMITPITTVVYVLAECGGALLGFWLLKVSVPEHSFDIYINNTDCGFCTTVLHPTVSISQGFLLEFVSTSLLTYVVCSVFDPKNANTNDAAAIKFGLLIAGISIAMGPFTGASMNPARSLAPAVVNNMWKDHWMYWFAPLSASAFTTIFYKHCFMVNVADQTEDSIKDQVKMAVKMPSLVVNDAKELETAKSQNAA